MLCLGAFDLPCYSRCAALNNLDELTTHANTVHKRWERNYARPTFDTTNDIGLAMTDYAMNQQIPLYFL